jgi:nucleoside-diphosphate-sugar epimerase
MRVLITGASGFLGSHVAEQLAEAGHEVVALVRKSSNTKHLTSLPNARLAYGTVEDAASVRAAAEGVDAIVHSAGLVKARDEAEFKKVNVEGTRNVAEAAVARIAAGPGFKRLVHVSSLAVMGPSYDGTPVASDGLPNPLTMYGRSKRDAEAVIAEFKDKVPTTIIRPPMIYGPRDNETLSMFKSVKFRFLPMLGGGDNRLSVIYVSDCASACIRAIDAGDVPSGSAFFVEDGDREMWKDMLAHMEAAMQTRAFVRMSVPMGLFKIVATANEALCKLTGQAAMVNTDKVKELSAPNWLCDSSDTQRALGWEPKVKWPEGTRRAAEWYKQNGWL